MNPMKQPHPRGNSGKTGWNKGSTKDTDPRILSYSHKISKTLKGREGKKHSLETKDKMSKTRVSNMRDNAFYSKRTIYNGVTLDSSYELTLAIDLDKNGIEWIRPKSLVWFDGNQKRRYIPDFFLPKFQIYLDPKNDFLIEKDRRKIQLASEYNNVVILVLSKNQLTWDIIKDLVDGVGTREGLINL